MESNLFAYIWRYSRREQLTILSLVLASLPFYFMSLSLPKSIVNGAIEGEGFAEPDSVSPFLRLEFLLPWSGADGAPQTVQLFSGIDLERVDYLFALSFLFLALVCINGLFKFQINTLKGRMGERLLRRLRFQLMDRVLRFPIFHYRKVKQSEVAGMVTSEVEPLGGFIGDAYAQPFFLGGQALTALLFIIVQSAWLGLVAVAVIAIQSFVIPRLRAPILDLGKQRVLAARALAGRVGELVDGASEVRVHDTSNYERADLSQRLERIYNIRYELFRRKFFVKFLNNFLGQVTPFLFYIIGGYLVINGAMDVGSVVAALLAYNQLPAPVKDLIGWDQQRLDVQIKFEQVVEQFSPDDMVDPMRQDPFLQTTDPLEGQIALSNVTAFDDFGARLLADVSFAVDIKDRTAVIGGAGSGKEQLGALLARLLPYSSGRASIGGRDLGALPDAVAGRRVSYAGPDVFLFGGDIRSNLLYGLKHRPIKPFEYGEAEQASRVNQILETERAGNSPFDARADWIDYSAAGVSDEEELEDWLFRVLELVDLDSDVYELGLHGVIPAERAPNLAKSVLEARAALHTRIQDVGLSQLIEPFDPDAYNKNATLAENILFGTPRRADFETDALASNPYMLRTIRATGIESTLIDMGYEIAETMVELFRDIATDHMFFDQFGFISADELPVYQGLLNRVAQVNGRVTLTGLASFDHEHLLMLPFRYVDARHRLGLIDRDIEERLIRTRKEFAANLPSQYRDAVEFYHPQKYNSAATIQDNVLMGRVAHGQAHARDRVIEIASDVLEQFGLRRRIFDVGLDFEVGAGGKRLTGGQRQKLGLARALIKRPDLLIVNSALALLDHESQRKIIDRVTEARAGTGIFWILARPKAPAGFDSVIVMEGGRVVDTHSLKSSEGVKYQEEPQSLVAE
jgi:putative ABC transport system ATP-binding protein